MLRRLLWLSHWAGRPAGEGRKKKRRNTPGDILDRDIVDPDPPGLAPFTSSRAGTMMLGRLPISPPGIFQVFSALLGHRYRGKPGGKMRWGTVGIPPSP